MGLSVVFFTETRATVVFAAEVRFIIVSDPNASGGLSTLRHEVITVKSSSSSHATSSK